MNKKANLYLRTGLVIVCLMLALAIVGRFWTPYSPTTMSSDNLHWYMTCST